MNSLATRDMRTVLVLVPLGHAVVSRMSGNRSRATYTLAHHDARSATKAQASEFNGHKRGGPYAIHDQSIMAQDVSALAGETVGKQSAEPSSPL